MSFIGSLGSIYNTTHEILLAACQKSKSCKRLVPSEFGGDIDKCPQLPRFFAKTRGEFREILKSQTEVEWTAVCCGWFMDYFVPANKSYLKEIPGWWPQDIVKWELELRGTGDEAQSFTLARDVAKAIVKLVEIPKWVCITNRGTLKACFAKILQAWTCVCCWTLVHLQWCN